MNKDSFKKDIMLVYSMENIDHTKTMRYCEKCMFWFSANGSCDCGTENLTKFREVK